MSKLPYDSFLSTLNNYQTLDILSESLGTNQSEVIKWVLTMQQEAYREFAKFAFLYISFLAYPFISEWAPAAKLC